MEVWRYGWMVGRMDGQRGGIKETGGCYTENCMVPGWSGHDRKGKSSASTRNSTCSWSKYGLAHPGSCMK